MSYWAAAQLQPQRDGLALHCLQQAGFETYAPRLREQRIAHGRKVTRTPLLFPGYLFVWIDLQWHAARWAPGVVRIVMNGVGPAAVPDGVIADLKARETGGLIDLPRPPKFRPGDRVRVIHGPFAGHVGLYAGMRPRERIEVLLAILGGAQRVTLSADAVEHVSSLAILASASARAHIGLELRRRVAEKRLLVPRQDHDACANFVSGKGVGAAHLGLAHHQRKAGAVGAHRRYQREAGRCRAHKQNGQLASLVTKIDQLCGANVVDLPSHRNYPRDLN